MLGASAPPLQNVLTSMTAGLTLSFAHRLVQMQGLRISCCAFTQYSIASGQMSVMSSDKTTSMSRCCQSKQSQNYSIRA